MKFTKKLWLFAIAVTLLTLLLTLCASAETVSGTCGATGNEENVTWTFDTETGALTVSGKGKMADYTKSYTNDPWRAYASQVTELTIEEGVTTVGTYAFGKLKNLQSISLPSTMTTIGKYSFYGCSSLDNLIIPGTATLGDSSFANCTSLKNLILEEGIKSVSARIFANCTALEYVVLPTTVTSIGYNVTAPFNGCTGLKSVTFLSKNVTFKPAVVEGNESTAIPLTAKIISHVGGTVETYAKENGYTFEEFEIVKGEKKCGDNLDWSLSSDGVLTVSGTGKMYAYSNNTSMPWYVYRKVVDKIIIEEGVTSVGERAFSDCSAKTVVIADSVTTINGYAFRICENLTDIHIGSGVTYIGEFAINGCNSLEHLEIPGNVKKLQHHAVNNCENLTSITLGEGMETLVRQAINTCKALEELTLPSTLKTLGTEGNQYSALQGCTGLKKITFLTKDVDIYPDSAAGLPESAVICGYKGSTAEAYATKYSRSFEEIPLPFAYNCIAGFDITAGTVKANAGEYLTIASLERLTHNGEFTLKFLAVDENGALYAYNADGGLDALLNTEGEAIVLTDNTAISIVYNDETGTARFYVNKLTPKYGSDLKSAVGYPVASEEFLSKTAVSEKFILAEGVTQQNITTITEAPALFAGFQVDDTHKSIRLLAGIDNLYYDSIGYEISLYSDDVLQNTVTKTINTVFSSVLDDKQPVTADELGFNYLALATVTNIDRTNFPEDAEVYFKIKPFSTIGGEKLYGIEKRITVTYDYTRQENNFVYGVDAEFIPVLRFIATSDIHFKGAAEGDSVGDGAPRLKKILSQMSTLLLDETKNDGYTGLDAVVLAGDIANNGTKYQLDLAKNYLDEIIPEGTELVITTGNHDWLEWETLTPEGTLKQFEDVFGEATKDTVINGYHFVTIAGDSAPTDMDTWRGYGWEYSAESLAKAEALIQAAIADTGADKPVFVIQHIANADTVAGSNNMTPRYTLKEMESKYPNLVVFSGHSHFTINDECSIHQESFTAVGTGTVQDSQIHLVEVDEYGRVRLRKYSGSKEDFLGETWFIDSFDPRDFKYTADRFTEDDLFFAEDAEIIPEYIGADNISFQFLPVPEESLTARGYRIVLKDASGAVISSEIVERSYKTEDFTTPVKHSFAALTPDTQYTVEVTALNPMYETEYDLEGMFESEPLVLNFKTAKQSDVSDGDLISLYINAMTNSAVNTASSGLTAVTKGTPMFSHDKTIGMDVVSFDGTTDHYISNNFYPAAEQIKDGFAIEAYFRIDEAPTAKDSVAFGTLQSAAFGLCVNVNGKLTFWIHNGSGYVKVPTTSTYTVGEYYHIVVTYDQSNAKIYVNGELEGSKEITELKLHIKEKNYKLLLGADHDQDNVVQSPTKTTFAKFNMYSEPLSADEVADAYTALS